LYPLRNTALGDTPRATSLTKKTIDAVTPAIRVLYFASASAMIARDLSTHSLQIRSGCFHAPSGERDTQPGPWTR
jgi:hypothetical protein